MLLQNLINRPSFGRAQTPQLAHGVEHQKTDNAHQSLAFRSKVIETQLPASNPSIRRLYFGKTAPSTGTIRMVTFNAENFFSFKSEEQLRAKAEVILQANPDVIALQEVGDKAFLEAFNRKYLNGKYPHILVEQCPTTNHRVAYLGRDFVRMEGVPHHHERQQGRSEGLRDFFEAKCAVDDYRLRIFNGHFRSMVRGEQESLPIRMEEATFAASILKRIFQQNPNERVLVVGDMNSRAESEQGRAVLQRLTLADDPDSPVVLKEVTREMKKRQGLPPNWDHSFQSGWSGARHRLDYMFASPGLLKDVVDAKVLGSRNEWPYTVASQHLPLLTVLQPSQTAKTNTLFSGNSTHLNLIA